jgi:hypothetical protein
MSRSTQWSNETPFQWEPLTWKEREKSAKREIGFVRISGFENRKATGTGLQSDWPG